MARIDKRATLVTSGLNGGTSLKDVTTPSGDPWFEDKDGKITQHSKTDPKMTLGGQAGRGFHESCQPRVQRGCG